MYIDHIAIYVTDIEAMKDFYVKYFGCSQNAMYHNPVTGLRTYFLTWESVARLELMSRPDVNQSSSDPFRRGLIHFAVSVGSPQSVDDLTQRLEQDGYTIYSYPRTTGDGYYESVILDPEGNMVEITV